MDVGGRKVKIVAEEMNDVNIKGAQGQNKARWKKKKSARGI